jgi:hypothetical protein
MIATTLEKAFALQFLDDDIASFLKERTHGEGD